MSNIPIGFIPPASQQLIGDPYGHHHGHVPVEFQPTPPPTNSPTLSLKLQVQGTNMIMVPGCEPSSDVSSDTLGRSMDCGKAMVNVYDALAAIPGSYIQLGFDSGSNVRLKWFVMPPIDLGCPCGQYPDYYGILKALAREEAEPEVVFDHCDTIGQGFCPSPDFGFSPPPPPDPYVVPGPNSGLGGGILTWPPPWAMPIADLET